MDFAIEISTDGTASGEMTFDEAIDGNLMNNIYCSLMIRRGSWFVNPAFGSRLYLLQRAKNTERTAALAAEYCKEALRWLIDCGRATTVTVTTERDRTQDTGRLKAVVEVTKATGETTTFSTWVDVI